MSARDEWTDTVFSLELEPPALSQGTSLREILITAWYDRHRIGGALLAGLALTAIAAFVAPRQYTAEASLLMRLGREYTYTPEVGDPAAGGAPVAYDREQSLQAESKILTSRDLKETVLKKMGLAQAFPDIAAKAGDPAAQHKAALLTFEKNLDADLLKGSNLMQVTYADHDPVVAARVLSQLIDAYLDRRNVIFSNANYETAAADFAARKTELQAAENKLATAKNDRKIRAFGEEQSLLLAQRNALEMKQSDMALALAQTNGRSASLRNSLRSVSGDVTLSSETQRSDAAESARKLLLDLKLKERDLSARYVPANPLVLDVHSDIDRATEFLRSLESNPNRTIKTGRSPARDTVETDLFHTLADEQQARTGDAVIAAQRAAVQARLAEFAISERQLPALERAQRMAEANYEASAKRLRDETALSDLDRKRRSSVSIVQSPMVPLVAKSMRGAILLVGIFLSLCAALLTAFLSALWRDTFLTPEDVERGLRLQLLAVVPMAAK